MARFDRACTMCHFLSAICIVIKYLSRIVSETLSCCLVYVKLSTSLADLEWSEHGEMWGFVKIRCTPEDVLRLLMRVDVYLHAIHNIVLSAASLANSRDHRIGLYNF